MYHRRILAFCLGLACLGLTTASAYAEKPVRKNFGKGNPFTVGELPAGKLKKKLETINPQARQKAMAWLHTFDFPASDAEHHLRVDDDGGVFIICPDGHHNCDGHNHGPVKPGATESDAATAESAPEFTGEDLSKTTESPQVESAAVPISSPPVYSSRPGATRHIYLDFNGALVSGKAWSETDGTTTWNSWDCAAWSTDADVTTFSDTEQAEMRRVWERIAEDYAPFDVNVTTDVAYDSVTYTGNKNNVGWLLFTNTTDKNGARCPHYGSGGVAYVGVFGNSNFFSAYQPAWVLPTGSANMAEAASHEMGHNMGLSHDGLTTGAPYYGGHNGTTAAPSWGPIMGTGYGRNVSQWSKGEYFDANQLEGDLAIISGRVPYRTDDHGDTFGSSTVWLNSAINQQGIVERTDNPDYFAFTTGAGTISFNASTYRCDSGTWGANVDVILELYNSSQALVATSNPVTDVNASISLAVAAGDYYLVVKPAAAATPLVASPSGYTSYGSLGQYSITGSIVPANGLILTSPNGGESWMQGSTQVVTWASGMGGNVKIELFKNGVLTSTIAASTANDGSHSWAIPSNQVLGANYRLRLTSLTDGSKTDESVSDFSITLPPIYHVTMDTNPGWTLGTGWGYGPPTGAGQDAYGSPDPTSGYSGANVIGYRLDGDYEGSITATRWATTPAINCSNFDNVKLNFWRWFGAEGGYDNGYVEVSNNGTSWTRIWENSNTNGVNDDDGNWVNVEYDISAVANNSSTVYVRWGMGTTDGSWNWCGWNLDEVKVTGDPIIAVGVVVTQSGGTTNVTEGGANDTYTVKLGSQPTANVTVNITPNSQVSVSPTSLTFTTSNWSTDQTVTVSAVNDTVNEYAHTGSITQTATSSDANYSGIGIDGILVGVTDNDNTAPAVIAGSDQTVFLTGDSWSPTDLAPVAWYDASDPASITQATGAVSQWNSKVGTSHMIQATSTKRPVTGTSQINGLNAIAFDGTDDALKTASNPFGASVSNAMFMAVTNIGTLTNSTMFSLTGGSTNRWQSHSPYGNGTVYFDCGGSAGVNRLTGASGWSAGQNKLLGFYCSTTDNVQQVWADGTSLLSDATGHTVTASSGLALGHDGGTGFDNCTMGEVVILNAAVSSTDRQKLEGYLAHKWGLEGSLPAAHPYKSQSPSNASAVANLDGTVSDANGDSLITTWSVVSGPSSVAFGNLNSVDTTATFTVAGTYTLRLSASDPGVTTNDDVVITVGTATGYVVSYNGNGSTGGTAPSNQTKTAGIDLTIANNSGSLVRAGYTYAGWNSAANGSGTDYATGATYSTDANLSLFAKWTSLTYTVTFDKQGGTGGSTSVIASSGSAMPAATAPTRTGYTFGGYFAQVSGGGTQYYTAAMASATNWNLTVNATLYALWTANSYTVAFDANLGVAASPTSKSVSFGSAYGTLATTSRTGFTFNGWFTAASGGALVSTVTIVTTASNHTLYAQWTAVPTYAISYNGNSNTGGAVPASQTKTQGVSLTLATNSGNLVRTGYTFVGWNTAAAGNGTDYAAGGTYTADVAVVLYAKWAINTYVVSYNANGATSGTAPGNQSKTHDIALVLSGNTGSLTRTGYTFAGWNTVANGTGQDYAAGGSYIVNSAVTLFAKWTANTYTVTYDGNSSTGGTVPSNQTKTHDIALTLATNTGNLVRTGFTFVGWNTSTNGTGTNYAVGASYTGNASLTLYAKWVLDTYTVTYNGNSSTGGSVPSFQTKNHDEPLTLATNSGGLVRTGYSFAGWNTNTGGDGTNYAEGAPYLGNANLTLYAKWTINTYVVSYNANSATSGTAPPDQAKTYNVSLNLATNTGNLARTGYTFSGWNTTADGSGVSYAVGAAYIADEALTLYAKWTPDIYVVSYNSNAATSGIVPANQTKVHDLKLTLSGNVGSLSMEGFIFTGWNTAANGSGTDYAGGSFYEGNAGLTLFAKWAANTYTIVYNGNGSTSGSAPVDASSYVHNGSVTVFGVGSLSRIPYTFAGWNVAANGSGIAYNPGNTFSIRNNTTLYAQWNPGPLPIYEPFADTSATLTGNTPGSGLTGTWVGGSGATVASGSLNYGSLANSGNRAGVTSGNVASVGVGSALADSGLLANGATLWFSFVIRVDASSTTSDQTGFSLGTAALGTGNNLPMGNGQSGIGVFCSRGSRLKAAVWNSAMTDNGPNNGLSANTSTLIVGKIVWGADNSAGETISIYKPGLDLSQPTSAHVTYAAAALNQATFDTISFARKGDANETDYYDEIRFGSTYEGVVGLGVINQIDHFEISPINSPQVVGDPIAGITITARSATNQAVTGFSGSVTFGGTAGITGTSDNFVNGVLTNVSITPTVAGTGCTFTVDDGSGHTGFVSLTINSRYTSWTQGSYTNTFTENAISGNPDGDDLTNLQEYAFGCDPTSSIATPLTYVMGGDVITPGAPILMNFAPSGHPAEFRAVFSRRKDRVMAGLNYTVVFSSDLGLWTESVTSPVLLTNPASTGEMEAVSVPFPAAVPLQAGGSLAPTFFRVRVE